MGNLWKLSNDFVDIGSRFGALLFAVVIIIILFNYLARGTIKEDLPFVVRRNFVFLRSLLWAISLLFIHTFVFIAKNGFQRFIWDEWVWCLSMNTYFLLAPEIVLFFILVIAFYISRKQLLNKTK